MIKQSTKKNKSSTITVPTYNVPDLRLDRQKRERKSTSTPKNVNKKFVRARAQKYECVLKDVGNYRQQPSKNSFPLADLTGCNQNTTRSKVFIVNPIQIKFLKIFHFVF